MWDELPLKKQERIFAQMKEMKEVDNPHHFPENWLVKGLKAMTYRDLYEGRIITTLFWADQLEFTIVDSKYEGLHGVPYYRPTWGTIIQGLPYYRPKKAGSYGYFSWRPSKDPDDALYNDRYQWFVLTSESVHTVLRRLHRIIAMVVVFANEELSAARD